MLEKGSLYHRRSSKSSIKHHDDHGHGGVVVHTSTYPSATPSSNNPNSNYSDMFKSNRKRRRRTSPFTLTSTRTKFPQNIMRMTLTRIGRFCLVGIFMFLFICLDHLVLNESAGAGKDPGKGKGKGIDESSTMITPYKTRGIYDYYSNVLRSTFAFTSTPLECRHLERIRQLDKEPLDPSIPSIFNCHSPHGKCQYYRPAHFFHPTCGILSGTRESGRSIARTRLLFSSASASSSSSASTLPSPMDTIRKHLQDMRKLRIEHRLWKDQPPNVIAWASYMKEMRMKKTGRHFMRQNLSFIHVHKVAGTSIVCAVRDLKLYGDTNNKKDGKKGGLDGDSNGNAGSTTTTTISSSAIKSNENQSGGNDNGNVPMPIDVEKYKGMYIMYNQGRKMEVNERAWNRTSAFLEEAVRYQREEDWDTVVQPIHDGDNTSTSISTTAAAAAAAAAANSNNQKLEQQQQQQQQQQKRHLNHMMVAVVRDPVERFISAVGQVTSSKFSKKGSGKVLKNKCLPLHRSDLGNHEDDENVDEKEKAKAKAEASEVLRCFVNIVKSEGYWIDIHFTPMILEISFATMQKDIPVAIFPFDQVPNILSEIGSSPNKKKKDGKVAGYRPSMLVNATIDDFEEDVLKDLCELYHMDVLFLRDMGYTTNCDGVTIDT